VWRGFANSEGQRNWHQSTTFNLQWSLYYRTYKAVKAAHAGFDWDRSALAGKMAEVGCGRRREAQKKNPRRP
jgi:hypothetical protein